MINKFIVSFGVASFCFVFVMTLGFVFGYHLLGSNIPFWFAEALTLTSICLSFIGTTWFVIYSYRN